MPPPGLVLESLPCFSPFPLVGMEMCSTQTWESDIKDEGWWHMSSYIVFIMCARNKLLWFDSLCVWVYFCHKS